MSKTVLSMPRTMKLNAAVAIATAMVFGFAFGAGNAIAGHDPGHENLMLDTLRGPDVLPMHEEMVGSGDLQGEAVLGRGGEISLGHEIMTNEDSTAGGGHHGMMGQDQGMGMMGMGPGMLMAPASGEPAAALTIDQVRQRMAAMMRGAGHGMRLGKVTALDDDLADVEVLDRAGAPRYRQPPRRRHDAGALTG